MVNLAKVCDINKSLSARDKKKHGDHDETGEDNIPTHQEEEERRKGPTEKLDRAEKGLVDMSLMLSEIQRREKKQKTWRTYNSIMMIVLILCFLCNFAVVWKDFALTRQVFLKGGRLVDDKGNPIKVKSSGEYFEVKLNQDFVRWLIGLHGRHFLLPGRTPQTEEAQHDFRTLGETIPVATVAVRDAHKMYKNSLHGVRQTITIVVNGITYSGLLGSSIRYIPSNSNRCEVYGGIKEEGTDYPIYRAICCGSGTDCDVYNLDTHRTLYFP